MIHTDPTIFHYVNHYFVQFSVHHSNALNLTKALNSVPEAAAALGGGAAVPRAPRVRLLLLSRLLPVALLLLLLPRVRRR